MKARDHHGQRRVPWTRERFLEWVQVVDSGCWFWLGCLCAGKGYGQLSLNGRPASAHRLAYRLWQAEIPPGRYVCHTCDVPRCVNPSHLFLGDAGVNARDAASKGRTLRGERRPRPNAKLDATAVADIRRRRIAGERGSDLAREYGVSQAAICQAHKGNRWAWVLA